MLKTWLVFFLLLPIFVSSQCSPGSIYNNDKCFTFFPAQVDFKIAESICMVSNGHLASVHNTFDNNFIAKQAQQYVNVNSSIWLGARSYSSNLNDPNSWNWTDGTSFDYQNYQSNQPKTIETQACMNLSPSNGKWSTASCINYAPFICEYPIPAHSTCPPNKYLSCPSEYYYLKYTDACYKRVIDSGDWDYGEWSCNQDGGHLASVHSSTENDFLTSITMAGVSVNKHLSINIGARASGNDGCNNNAYWWVDGSGGLSYTNWAHGEPNNCKKELWNSIMPDPISKDYNPDGGQWNNVQNTDNRGFICKLPVKR